MFALEMFARMNACTSQCLRGIPAHTPPHSTITHNCRCATDENKKDTQSGETASKQQKGETDKTTLKKKCQQKQPLRKKEACVSPEEGLHGGRVELGNRGGGLM